MSLSFQLQVLDRVLDHYPKRSNAVAALSELLGLGKDAIYRRLRGESILTPDELSQIAQHYDISLDALLFAGGDKVFFSFNAFRAKPTSFAAFLEDVHQQVEQATLLPEVHFYYASMEVPVFHYQYFHELIAFKLYVWGRITWDLAFLQNRPFSLDVVTYPDLQKSDEILSLYNRLPSTELWTLRLVDNTLNQIEFVATIGQFAEPHLPLLLCDKLSALLEHMQSMASKGYKFSVQAGPDAEGASFDLYHNELLSTNNTILVESPAGDFLYTTFANPNFMVSADPRLCDYSKEWLKTALSKSVPIGTNAEKNRMGFFQKLLRKVQTVRSRLEAQQEND